MPKISIALVVALFLVSGCAGTPKSRKPLPRTKVTTMSPTSTFFNVNSTRTVDLQYTAVVENIPEQTVAGTNPRGASAHGPLASKLISRKAGS